MDVYKLLDTAKEQFEPPERIKVSEWAAKHYELPETSAEPGRWLLNRAPYQAGIMDAIAESGIQKVSIMCCAQIGKTIILLAIICYLIDLDPCSMLMTFPSVDAAEIFSKEKLASAIANVKPVSKKVVAKSRNASSTILMKMFAGGFLRITGANSPSSLASMSIRAYFGDEIDKYPQSAGDEGDPVKLAIERTSTFWNWLVLLVSTPGIIEDSAIARQFEASDKRRYFMPCPHCNHYQHLIWERIEYADKGTERADPVLGVYYICEGCDRPIEEKYKAQMIRSGEWRATAVAKDARHAGFHLNRLCSPWKSWVDLALDYEASRLDTHSLQVFVNSTLGLPFERVTGEKLDWERLRDRASAESYSSGVVPNGGYILTAGVDVQQDRLEVAVWAWGHGEEAWLIQYDKIIGDPLENRVWEQLAHVTSTSFEREDGEKLRIRATCIDSGYLTQEVYHWVRTFKYLHWFAIKGISGDRPLVAPPTTQEINYKGQKIKQGIQLYKVGVDRAKETLYARSRIETPGAKYLHFPNDMDSNWFEGFCSEVLVTKHKNGRPYTVWEKLAGVRNEPIDISVYALAAAHLVGVQRIRWEDAEDDKDRSREPKDRSSELKDRSRELKDRSSELKDRDGIHSLPHIPSKKVIKNKHYRRRRGNNLLDRY